MQLLNIILDTLILIVAMFDLLTFAIKDDPSGALWAIILLLCYYGRKGR
jgi:hypothetical protein